MRKRAEFGVCFGVGVLRGFITPPSQGELSGVARLYDGELSISFQRQRSTQCVWRPCGAADLPAGGPRGWRGEQRAWLGSD